VEKDLGVPLETVARLQKPTHVNDLNIQKPGNEFKAAKR